jgi:hypothetical protein
VSSEGEDNDCQPSFYQPVTIDEQQLRQYSLFFHGDRVVRSYQIRGHRSLTLNTVTTETPSLRRAAATHRAPVRSQMKYRILYDTPIQTYICSRQVPSALDVLRCGKSEIEPRPNVKEGWWDDGLT